jgi:erythromycin esterase-like protein
MPESLQADVAPCRRRLLGCHRDLGHHGGVQPIGIDLDGEHGSIEPFGILDDLAAKARFAFLVEPEHCIHERHEFRLLCMRYLASRGWSWFGEEVDWRWGERVDAYVTTGDEALLDPVDDHRLYTSGLLAPADAAAPHEALHAEHRRAAQVLRRTIPHARYFGFDSGGGDPEFLRIANALTTLEEGQEFMAYRERLMHHRIAAVATANPDVKIALMAGGAHLAKDDSRLQTAGPMAAGGGESTIGHHVAHALTDRPVLAIWLLYGGGRTASPYVPSGDLDVPDGSLNAELAQVFEEPALIPVGADAGTHTIISFGLLSCDLADQVDAIVFAPRVTPVQEEPT